MGLKAKLGVLIVLGAAGAVAAGSVEVWVARDGRRALEAINTDTLVPLQRLQRIGDFIREVELRIPGVMTGMFSGPGSKSYIETVLPEMRDLWSEIERRPVDARTAGLQQEFERAFRQLHEGLLPKLMAALGKEDRKALEGLADEWLSLKKALLKPHTALMTAWQEEVVRAVARAEDQQRKTTWGVVVAVALCLGLMVASGASVGAGHRRAHGRGRDPAQATGSGPGRSDGSAPGARAR